MSRDDWRSGLALLLLVLLAHHLLALGTGFYLDDWIFLERARRGGGLWASILDFARHAADWNRPLQVLQIPLFYALAAPWPPAGQLLLWLLESAEAFLLFLLLRRLTGSRGLAFAAAVWMVLFPGRGIVHVWLSNASQLLSHCLVLAAMLLHLDWVETRRRSRLTAGLACYLAGVLCYESPMFTPFLLLGGLAARDAAGGAAWKEALRRRGLQMTPFLAPLAMAVLWQRLGARAIAGSSSKPLELSLGYFLKAYGAAFECVTNRVVHACATSAGPFFLESPGGWILLWGALAAAAAWALSRSAPARPDDRAGRRALLGAAAGAFVGAYLPFALSGTYMPQVYGIMSRTNAAGAWVTGMLLAGAFSLGPARLRPLALAAVLGPFAWADWQSARDWAKAWAAQNEILDKVAARAPLLPEPAAILLTGAPSYVGKAVVFDAHYDFDYALRQRTGRKGIGGTTLSARVQFRPDGVVETLDGVILRSFPYRGLFLYDYSKDSWTPVSGPL